MCTILERISNRVKGSLTNVRNISQIVEDMTSAIMTELGNSSAAIKSFVRLDRKGVIIVHIPESKQYEVRKEFDLSVEPTDFVIQCRNMRENGSDNEVIVITVGFMNVTKISDTIDVWVVEEPIDGTEVKTLFNTRKMKYTLKQLSNILGDERGRNR